MLWKAQNWLTDQSLRQIWARSMLHLVDTITHVPELRLLNSSDQLRLIVSRGMNFGGLLVIHRTLRNSNLKCILTSGGTYLPLDQDELVNFRQSGALSHCVDMCEQMYDTLVLPIKEMKVTDDELIFLRLITFFTAGNSSHLSCLLTRSVPRLSPEGRKVVDDARNHYEQLFINYLHSKLDPKAAIDRMTRVLGILPILEVSSSHSCTHFSFSCQQVAIWQDTQITRASVFNVGEFRNSLTHQFHFARMLRDGKCF